MPEIELKITYINETIICFKSEIFLNSIGTIQVLTPVGTINFYIDNILISFFFV